MHSYEMYLHCTAQYLRRAAKLKRSGISSEERGLQTTAPTTQLCWKSSSPSYFRAFLTTDPLLPVCWALTRISVNSGCSSAHDGSLKATCSPLLHSALPTLHITFNTRFRPVFERYDRIILFVKKKGILYTGLAHNLSFPKLQIT